MQADPEALQPGGEQGHAEAECGARRPRARPVAVTHKQGDERLPIVRERRHDLLQGLPRRDHSLDKPANLHLDQFSVFGRPLARRGGRFREQRDQLREDLVFDPVERRL